MVIFVKKKQITCLLYYEHYVNKINNASKKRNTDFPNFPFKYMSTYWSQLSAL